MCQRQSRLPPTATKTVRSNSSAIVENLLRSTASKLPAPGTSRTQRGWMQLYGLRLESILPMLAPMCAQCLLLLWGALEGLGRPLLRGRLSTGRRARLVFKTRAGWDTVDSGSKSRPTSSVPPRCLPCTAPRHIWVRSLSGRACCAMGVGLRLRPSQLCSFTVLLPTGSGDGLCALDDEPSLRPIAGSRSYLVWDATRRELWETALLSRPAGCQFVSIGRNDSH